MPQTSRYKVTSNREVASQTWQMRLEGDTSVFSRGGQFVDVAVCGHFLRRPFAVREWDDTGFDILYKVVGHGTEEMSRIQAGTVLDILTGLGNGFDASRCKASALVVSGGLGASPVFSLVKELVAGGRSVTVVMGYNTADDILLFDEYKASGADIHISTLDGSKGVKGFVTDVIDALHGNWDYFYTCGPKVMMKAVCEKLEIPGEASLEERMGCGCGICYGCTCHTAKGPKRVCADGPVFRKEDIIW